jgi:hypothetical protein
MFNIKWLMMLLVVFAAGCKKVIEEPGLVGLCPIVVSTNPANNAIDVSVNTSITATFNEGIIPLSINAVTFIVKKGTTSIPGLVSYTGLTATFTPANNLSLNTTYTATITRAVKDSAGNSPISDYVWNFTTGASSDITAPTVISTDPLNAATGVVINKKIAATFSEAMNALTINISTFIVKQGTTAIAGTVAYAGTTAIFSPSANLTSNTTYIATITTGAKDIAGNAMAADYVWSFTTSTLPDVVATIVITTDPINAATGVPLTKKVTAIFSKSMNPLTINITTFILKQGSTSISGTVSYAGTTAVFSPLVNLTNNTTYTATITTGAQDLTGIALVSNYVWSFTTGGGATIPPPFLGSAAIFGAFGGNAGVTNQGIFTVINNGSIGSTAASTLITGFHDGTTGDVYTETPLNVGNVTGRIYTAPPAPGNATSFAIATKALLDATTAYISLSPANQPGGIDPGAGELGGLTLAPGIYKAASGTFKITNGNLTLDAQGDPNAEWVFQTAAGLTVGTAGPAGARSIIMINGALPKNVYWYVGSTATINGAGGGIMVGNILANSGVTFSTAGNVVQTVLNGRAISLISSVTMVNTTVNVPN